MGWRREDRKRKRGKKYIIKRSKTTEREKEGGHLGDLAEDGEHAGPDQLLILGSVDLGPETLLLVVIDDGNGLLVVGDETLLESLGVVVGALDEGLTGDVVLHGDLGGSELLVVGATGGDVDQATSDAGDEEVVIDGELDNGVQALLLVLQHGIQLLSLDNSAGESIENESVLALLVVLQVVLDHVDHDLVTDESTSIHDLLGLHTDLGLVGNGSAEHVTGGQVADAVLLLDLGSLGTLTY